MTDAELIAKLNFYGKVYEHSAEAATRLSVMREALEMIRDFDAVPSYGHLLKDIARAALGEK